ncbi:MAG: hypothetical protein PHW75_02000 [Patescibacteria group bacterium]|nr:hypothetical protein [Patescibacteria group bacterium]
MKRYTDRSSMKKLHIIRSVEKEFFYAEVIHKPHEVISRENQKEALKEISNAVEKAWGKFSPDYLTKSILESHFLLLLRNDKDELIGVAPIKKIRIDGRYVFSFGLTVVDPDYQGFGFMKKMHMILSRRAFIENILQGKTKVEFVFITPNISTIGALAKVADFMYPNPYDTNGEGQVSEADDYTWETVKLFLKASGEKYRELKREGSVMIGFYDDKPHLIVKNRRVANDKNLDKFAKRYLKPGNEVVVRGVVGLIGVIRNGF